jgi:predicted methyltransferase
MTEQEEIEEISYIQNSEEDYTGEENQELEMVRSRSRTRYNRISYESRVRVVNALLSGQSVSFISNYENIPITTIRSIYKNYLDTGSIHCSQRGGSRTIKITKEMVII